MLLMSRYVVSAHPSLETINTTFLIDIFTPLLWRL